MTSPDRHAQQSASVRKWPKKSGRADYIRHLDGERLTRAEAIRAKCYECVCGEDTEPCLASLCPLIQYCQWNRSEQDSVSGNTEA